MEIQKMASIEFKVLLFQSESTTEGATRGVLRNFTKFTGKHLC